MPEQHRSLIEPVDPQERRSYRLPALRQPVRLPGRFGPLPGLCRPAFPPTVEPLLEILPAWQ
jgi:hypothetical protein